MSRPDFDGVYRTRPPEGVFSGKKRPDFTGKKIPADGVLVHIVTTHQDHLPIVQKNTPQKTAPGGNLPTSPANTPFRGGVLRGEVNGEVIPTPVTPTNGNGEVWGGKEKTAPKTKRQRKAKKPPFIIIEDTREQTPLRDWPEGAAVEVHGLDTGDYSIVGWENCFAIERKSITDLAGTMIGGFEGNTQRPRKRFNNELERMRHFDCAAVIVTATPEELITFKHNCGMDAHAALWNFALSVFARYGIPVFPLTDEKTAARWIYDLARHYINVRTKQNRSHEDRAKSIAAEWGF